MGTALALILAAAAAQAAPASGAGAQATGLASAVILRAETASEQGGKDGLARHVRRQLDGRVSIEFE